MTEKEKKQMSRKEFEEQLLKKAHSDKEFKTCLADNPKVALDELTDEQLDKVAGGIDDDNWCENAMEALRVIGSYT